VSLLLEDSRSSLVVAGKIRKSRKLEMKLAEIHSQQEFPEIPFSTQRRRR
jgi:hypothetical protein